MNELDTVLCCINYRWGSVIALVYYYTEVNLFLCTIKLVLLGVVCELGTSRVPLLCQFLQEQRFEQKAQYLLNTGTRLTYFNVSGF